MSEAREIADRLGEAFPGLARRYGHTGASDVWISTIFRTPVDGRGGGGASGALSGSMFGDSPWAAAWPVPGDVLT